jgi:hypothetical protein
MDEVAREVPVHQSEVEAMENTYDRMEKGRRLKARKMSYSIFEGKYYNFGFVQFFSPFYGDFRKKNVVLWRVAKTFRATSPLINPCFAMINRRHLHHGGRRFSCLTNHPPTNNRRQTRP